MTAGRARATEAGPGAGGLAGAGSRAWQGGRLWGLAFAGAAAIGGLGSPSPASAQAAEPPRPRWHGPLTAEEGSPFQRLGYTIVTEGADPVAAGSLSVSGWVGYGNLFERDSTEAFDLRVDVERVSAAFTLRYGVAEGLEVGGRLGLESRTGGVLDPTIQRFHDLLGLERPSRESTPTGQHRVRLSRADGETVLDIPRTALAMEEVRVFGKWRVAGRPRSRATFALRGELRIPTASGPASGERTDVAGALLARVSFQRLHLHGLVGLSSLRAVPEQAAFTQGRQLFGMMALEYALFPSVSAVAQVVTSTQRLKGFDDPDVDGPLNNLVLGFRGRWGEAWGWELGMQEDIPPWGPAADFTLQVGVHRRW